MVRANRKKDFPRWFRQHCHHSFEDSAWRRKRNHHNRRENGAGVAEMQRRDRVLCNSGARASRGTKRPLHKRGPPVGGALFSLFSDVR
jgi:hypothetical protein